MVKNSEVVLTVLCFVLMGPMVIHCLFKLHPSIEFFIAEWDAAAMLSYYGSIVAAVIAIYGIFITIQYSQKSYRDDVRNRSMPFIVIDILKTKSYKNLLKSENEEDIREKPEGYQEYKSNNYYCILDKGNIDYKTELTKSMKEVLGNGGISYENDKNVINLLARDVLYIPVEIENIGNGVAIRMQYGVNRKETRVSDRSYYLPFSLKLGTPLMLYIFSADCSKNSLDLGQYVLSFCYEDIYSNRYEQHFDINIQYDEEKGTPSYSVDMSQIQDFLGEKTNGQNENGIS